MSGDVTLSSERVRESGRPPEAVLPLLPPRFRVERLLGRGFVHPRLLAAPLAEGFESVHDVEALTNLLHPDGALGRLDVMWLDGTTSERVFRDGADLQHLLAVEGLGHDEVRGSFVRAGLGELHGRLRTPG